MSQTVESTRTRYNLRSAETCTGLEWTVHELEQWRNFGWGNRAKNCSANGIKMKGNEESVGNSVR